MRRKLVVLVAFVSLVITARVFAKADISKITIKGADSRTPDRNHRPKDSRNFQCLDWPGNKRHHFQSS